MGALADIAHVVEESAKVNTAQLCGTEDGQVIVSTYDWKTDFQLSLELYLTLSITTFVFQLRNQVQCTLRSMLIQVNRTVPTPRFRIVPPPEQPSPLIQPQP